MCRQHKEIIPTVFVQYITKLPNIIPCIMIRIPVDDLSNREESVVSCVIDSAIRSGRIQGTFSFEILEQASHISPPPLLICMRRELVILIVQLWTWVC